MSVLLRLPYYCCCKRGWDVAILKWIKQNQMLWERDPQKWVWCRGLARCAAGDRSTCTPFCIMLFYLSSFAHFGFYLRKRLEETLGTESFRASLKFCNVAIIYKQKQKDVVTAMMRPRTSMKCSQGLICWCVNAAHRKFGHAPDGSCMSLRRGGAHTVYFAKLERVRAINTSAAR